ncbi:MAG: DUF2520 domain-containing protein [Caldisericia bacterium]|nr:DUF2520 domain-containing protein [Caldisericia bacterium]MDD4614484.1 DUF2520 domain-containing protein [Caldisericia bacterium]
MKSLQSSTIGFIGAGKVGNALGLYFYHSNLCIGGYYSLHTSSSQKSAHNTQSIVFQSISECAQACDILFITTPDGAIAEVWNDLKQVPLHGKIVCHTSGVMSSQIFDGIEKKGAIGYAIHPVVPITSDPNAYRSLYNAYFTVEGPDQHLEDLQLFFSHLGNSVVCIEAEKKHMYHAANVLLSSFLSVLIHTGWELLQECNIPLECAQKMTKPLIETTIQSVFDHGITDSLTGPVDRNDVVTIQRHLDCLPLEKQRLYAILSSELVNIAQNKHPQNDYSSLKELFQTVLSSVQIAENEGLQ